MYLPTFRSVGFISDLPASMDTRGYELKAFEDALRALVPTGLPPVIVPVNLEETEEVALVTEKSVETGRVPPIFSRDDDYIDWANIDLESFVVPADKVERQRLLRAIRDEITDRQNRQEHYVVAVCFKGHHVDPPDPKSVEIDKLLDLMERFPIVRSF